jgi:hypothetical protein
MQTDTQARSLLHSELHAACLFVVFVAADRAEARPAACAPVGSLVPAHGAEHVSSGVHRGARCDAEVVRLPLLLLYLHLPPTLGPMGSVPAAARQYFEPVAVVLDLIRQIRRPAERQGRRTGRRPTALPPPLATPNLGLLPPVGGRDTVVQQDALQRLHCTRCPLGLRPCTFAFAAALALLAAFVLQET